jgi:putative transposase
MTFSLDQRRQWITPKNRKISVRQQCQLLGLAPSSYYYQAEPESAENLEYMRLLDQEYTDHPFYGVRKMTVWLQNQGHAVGPKRVRRLLRAMGLMAVYPKPRLSLNPKGHQRFPYLLKGMPIVRPNQVWSTDITYIRLNGGFVFLAAIMDWYSRYVLDWELSITLESDFCVDLLKRTLVHQRPEIFNTDQGVQFTSAVFQAPLHLAQVRLSMDGTRQSFRQHIRGKIMAHGQIRGSLPQGIPNRVRGAGATATVFRILQQSAISPIPGQSHAPCHFLES